VFTSLAEVRAVIARWRQDYNQVRSHSAHGGRLGARDADGRTVLWHTAAEGRRRTVVELLRHGARPHATDADGYSALMEAARRGHDEVLAALVAAGADIDARSRLGNTPLLLAAGVDPHLRNGRREQAQTLAAAAGHDDIVSLLNAKAGAMDWLRRLF